MRGREDHEVTFAIAELRYEYGLTLREIGEEFGVGPPTVHHHLRRHELLTRLP